MKFRYLAAIAALALVTAACGDITAVDNAVGDPATPVAAGTTAEPRVIDVELTEFAITADTFDVETGETVTFVVTNNGVVEHEFELSNDHEVEEHLASGHAEHQEDMDVELEEEAEELKLVLAPGATGELTVTFEDTTTLTQIVCLIPGHYEAGMEAAITFAG